MAAAAPWPRQRTISRTRSSSWPRRHRTTSTARSSRSTAGGSFGNSPQHPRVTALPPRALNAGTSTPGCAVFKIRSERTSWQEPSHLKPVLAETVAPPYRVRSDLEPGNATSSPVNVDPRQLLAMEGTRIDLAEACARRAQREGGVRVHSRWSCEEAPGWRSWMGPNTSSSTSRAWGWRSPNSARGSGIGY